MSFIRNRKTASVMEPVPATLSLVHDLLPVRKRNRSIKEFSKFFWVWNWNIMFSHENRTLLNFLLEIIKNAIRGIENHFRLYSKRIKNYERIYLFFFMKHFTNNYRFNNIDLVSSGNLASSLFSNHFHNIF